MRKLLSILALALCFVACQNEPEVNVSNNDIVDVVLNIEAPELGITRAGKDGQDDSKNAKDSAHGAIDYADDAFWGEYDLRYTLEVYAADEVGTGTPIARERLVNFMDRYASTTFTLRLVPNREYKFVVFADFVAQDSKENLYYDTKDLRDITSITTGEKWNAMNEARDAYFVSENVTVTTGLKQTLILTRALAKLRVVTTDILDLEKYTKPHKVVVTYYNHPIFKSFNAINGAISTEMTGDELTYVVEYKDQYDAGYDSKLKYPSYMTLFSDYVHAIAGQHSSVNFRMDVYEKSGRLIKSNDFSTEIPVQRNYLTTIMGNALTTEANIEILISDEFVGWYDVDMPEGLFDNDTVAVGGFEDGGTYANGAYSYEVANAETGDSFTLNILEGALTEEGTLAAGEYNYGEHFTASNVNVNVNITRSAGAVAGEAVGGKMVVNIEEDGKYAIAIDLEVKTAEGKAYRPSFGFYGDFLLKVIEPLAKPEVTAAVVGNVVTLTWEAVDGADKYGITRGTNMPVIVEETTYEFTGEYNTEYTFHVVALPADESVNTYSEACEVTVTTEKETLATPEVTAAVDGNVVTLTWEAVENAAYYTVQVDDNIAEKVDGTTYTFPGDLGVEYMFTVIAYPADDTKNASKECVVKATTAPAVKVVTVDEFLAAAEDTQMYQLTGVITSVVNTTYGNFYLKDETGEVLIYGLCSPEGEQKYWAASGAKVGDTITVQTLRTSHNGAPQGKNALFVELKPFVAEASEWGIVGDLTDWGKNKDIVMYTTWHTANLFVAYNVEINSGAFKVRANNAWDNTKNYGLEVAGSINADKYYTVITSGGSNNITPMTYGTYDVYFDLTNKRVALMTPGKEYAEATDGGNPVVVVAGLKDHEWGLVGSFNGWDVANYAVTVVKGDWAVAENVNLEKNAQFKFAADKAWTLSYGTGGEVNVGETYTTYNNGGNMKFVGEAGAYDVYFSLVEATFYMEKHVEKTEQTATITFDDTAKRTTYTTSQQVWEENDIIVTNDKASSTNNVGDYAKPARFYKGSNVKIEAPGAILSISIDVSGIDSKYKTAWGTDNNGIVTITLEGTSNTYEFKNLSAQARANKMTITYIE